MFKDGNWLDGTTSVWPMACFWKFFCTNFLLNEDTLFGKFLSCFQSITFYVKTDVLGNFWKKLAYLLFPRLVTLDDFPIQQKACFFKKRPTIRLNCFGKFTSWLTSLNEDAVGLMIKVFSNPVRDKKVLNFLQNEFLCIEDAFLLSPL